MYERPTDLAIALFVTATLLGAEHDLCAVLAVGVFVTAVGVLGRRACAAVLLCPELEVAFGTQEVQAVVKSAIATLVTADVIVCAAEHDDGNRTFRVALCAVGLVQVHSCRSNCCVNVGHEACHMVTHTATHRETGCINALGIDADLFFNGLDHFARELDVVIVRAARTHVPACTHHGLSTSAIRVEGDDAFRVCLGLVSGTAELALARTADRVVVNNERYRLVALVGARHMHDERTVLAVDSTFTDILWSPDW